MKHFKILLCSAILATSSLTQAQDAAAYKEFIEFHRAGYKQAFVNDPNAPLKAEDLKNVHFFDVDINYRVEAKIDYIQNAKPFNMPTFDGSAKSFVRYATATGTLNGKTFKLTLYKNLELADNPMYKDYLFLPFTDMTNGQSTYGGGRYMDFRTQNIEDGKLLIDFNKAYNPYCAFSTGYRCPVPPQENDLNFEIKAGEMKYTGQIKTRAAN